MSFAGGEVDAPSHHIEDAPWRVVPADNKKKARLNCIRHFLDQVPYDEVPHQPVTLPQRVRHEDYERNEVPEEMIVPQVY